MNPLLLLLGLFGTGALMSLGDSRETGKFLKKPEDEDDDVVAPISKPAPAPAPEVVDPAPTAPEQTGGSEGEGGGTEPVVLTGTTLEVIGGRVTTLSAGEDAASVEIISGPENGTLVANADGTLSLVLTRSDHLGHDSLSYRVTHADGSTTEHVQDLSVVAGPQASGWATGEATYMLATDEDGHVIVEAGENHVTVYVTGSDAAWSPADIAAAEGLDISEITVRWMIDQGTYGFSEDMALDAETAQLLWKHGLSSDYSQTSNHLLMECGYTYDFDKLLKNGVSGESELNPLYFGSWGEGEKPVMLNNFGSDRNVDISNIVIQGLVLESGFNVNNWTNVIIDDCVVKGASTAINTTSLTIRDTAFYDIVIDEPLDEDGDGYWDTTGRTGLYADGVEGLLMEGNFFDHIGWEDDFHRDGSVEGGMPPTWFSHNLYIDNLSFDVTIRDTISMRAALDAMNLRSGGYVEDFVALDNATGITNYGGAYYGEGAIGNYLFMTDTLVSESSFLNAPAARGIGRGIIDKGQMSTLLDTLIVHLTDPNQPIPENSAPDAPLVSPTPYYDDTIIWNWYADIWNSDSWQANFEGLDPEVMNATTVSNYLAALFADGSADYEDLANLLKAQYAGTLPDLVDADAILAYFQSGFGIASETRTEATTLVFEPDDLGDGVRWDNRINWSTEDLPGQVAGDSADLNGADVVFGGNAAIAGLDLGGGGRLTVHGGRLSVGEGLSGTGDVVVEGSGQIWVGGSDGDDIDIAVTGGRFVNEGDMAGVDLTQTGGQAILASDGAEYDLDAGHRLALFASAAKVGFDGDAGGLAILDAHAGGVFDFDADAGGLATIEEFRSGAMGDSPDVLSGIDLGGATLEIDLAGLDAAAGTSFTLMDADEITGLLDVALGGISGLGSRDATIVVDYVSDKVTLELTSGSGSVSVKTVGEETMVTDGEEALWNALTEGQGLVAETMSAEEEDAYLDAVA